MSDASVNPLRGQELFRQVNQQMPSISPTTSGTLFYTDVSISS